MLQAAKQQIDEMLRRNAGQAKQVKVIGSREDEKRELRENLPKRKSNLSLTYRGVSCVAGGRFASPTNTLHSPKNSLIASVARAEKSKAVFM